MEIEHHSSHEEISKFQEISIMQQYLFNLTEENYITAISFLNGSRFVQDSMYHETFLRNIFWAFQLRPKSISTLFDIFIWFSRHEDIITPHSTITSLILTFFIRCHSNYESHSKFIHSFFSGLFQILDSSFDIESTNPEYITTFCHKLLQLNQEEITRIKRAISFQSEDILSIIYNDNIEKFINLSSRPEFNINSQISIESPFLFSVNKNMTLIEVAASLGSVQIFKYILINEGILNGHHQISQYSIDGGCTEIIRIVEQKGFPFKEAELGEASYYHQLSILQWILDSKGVSNITEALKKSATSNFAEGILFFENNSEEYSKSFYSCQNLIEWAAFSGSFDVLNFLLSNEIHQLNNTIFSVVEYGELCSANRLKDRFHSCINKMNKARLRPIHIAAQKGDFFMASFLIDSFPELEINAQDRYGATVLHLSIRYNHSSVFELFMNSEKVDVNLCDFGDTSPLHEAVMSDNPFFIKRLLEDERTNINIVDQSGKTPLITAIDSSSIEYVTFLLNSKKSIENFEEAVYESVSKNCSEISKELFYSTLLEINNPKLFESIIEKVISANKFEYIQFFIDQKRFNINLKFGIESKTILHLCCSIKELFAFIPAILKRDDVDVNARDSNGLSPLHEAMRSQNNNFSICLIKDPRVDINAKDNGNQTPLHYAVSNWSVVPLTDLLLNPKIDVNLIDKDGKTALFVACELGVVDNVEILLNDYKVDTEIEIESVYLFFFFFLAFKINLFVYYTAIQMAGRKGHIEVVNVYRKYQNTILKSKQQQESKCYIS